MSHILVLVGFCSCASIDTCLTVLDSVLDGVPEGRLDDPFPQDEDEPLIGDYEYESDTDLNDWSSRDAPPASALAPEWGQISKRRKLP